MVCDDLLVICLLLLPTADILITGVISDYKESEKIPGDMASSLETIYDEAYIINKNKKTKETKEFIIFYKEFLKSVNDWFYRKERTKNQLLYNHEIFTSIMWKYLSVQLINLSVLRKSE